MTVPPPNYAHLVLMSEAISKCLGAILSEMPSPDRPLVRLIDLRNEYDTALKDSHPDNTQSPEALLSPQAFALRLVNDAINQFVSITVERQKAYLDEKMKREEALS